MGRKGTVRHLTYAKGSDGLSHIQSLTFSTADGGSTPPIAPPFLGGAGDPTHTVGYRSSAPGAQPVKGFFGFIAVPRPGDEVSILDMSGRPIALVSAFLGAAPQAGQKPDARFPNLAEGETGQYDGDGHRTADIFHGPHAGENANVTDIFQWSPGGVRISVDSTGQILTIIAPSGMLITGDVTITGSVTITGHLTANGTTLA